ncbi:hypothetical protein [Nocardia brasiliensis]|uniref:hypothetical protein n=1 Tax=Nocardia brasiliensis TaxID=37326 RepID=UPI0024556103|nr:hypothetical protein [Nocardia brasiliensis]
MIAKLVFPEHDYWVGDAKIYHLDTPYQGHDHVAVTVHPVIDGQWQNAGVTIVGCNADGFIVGDHVIAIWSSYVVMSHAEALGELGYSQVS